MSELISVVGQVTKLLTALIAIYFAVGLVINIAQAQLASGTGDTLGYARALQQGVVMVVLIALTASMPSIIEFLQSRFGNAVETAGGAVRIWKAIAQLVISTVVGGAAIYTVVVSVWSSVSVQAGMVMGSSSMVSTAMARVWKLILGVVATVLVVAIANWIIGLLF